ncbi:MAG: VOC family protein [Gemmatimonadota bacterium]|nr:VOC family protein [Gemmatimonadota bacterium]
MPQLETYIFFDGNCAEAMRFYESVLGGKMEIMMSHKDSPEAQNVPPEMADWIIHARLDIGGRKLMASDSMAGNPIGGAKGFSLSLAYADEADAKRVFDALCDGGRITMPMQSTFWAKSFGMVVDKFGTSWMVNGAQNPM